MNRLLLSVVSVTFSISSWAQSTPTIDRPLNQVSPSSKWALGAGVSVKDSPYAGEGSSLSPFPLIIYEGDRFFFRGTEAGWKLVDSNSLEFSAISSLRLDGFDIDDLGEGELAENGVDYRMLEDRDHGLDVGLAATWHGAAGELKLKLLTDVSSASDGQLFSATYGYPLKWGKTRLTPNLRLTWLSSDSANYYYGTLEKEIERGVARYEPGSVLLPSFGITAARPIGDKWALFGSAEYLSLPDEIRDSPLTDSDKSSSSSIRVGISRRF